MLDRGTLKRRSPVPMFLPTQRFEVVQKNKVRGFDSATTHMINQVTVIAEKLQLPSTDSNVAALRALKSAAPLAKLAEAYRQVAIRPEHRNFFCLKDPETATPAFFVMIGHSFGLVSAVYSYNRRSAAINEIMDGFEVSETVRSARLVAECVHTWLGAKFDQKKLQLSTSPTILGVTYSLDEMLLEILNLVGRKSSLMRLIASVHLVCSTLDQPAS